jgi:hypothetical protein
MKGQSWDDFSDSSKDFFDANGFLTEADFEEDVSDKRTQRRRLTELRRRTEERLDWKRMYGELQFDDLDLYDDGDSLDGVGYSFDTDRGEFDDEF